MFFKNIVVRTLRNCAETFSVSRQNFPQSGIYSSDTRTKKKKKDEQSGHSYTTDSVGPDKISPQNYKLHIKLCRYLSIKCMFASSDFDDNVIDFCSSETAARGQLVSCHALSITEGYRFSCDSTPNSDTTDTRLYRIHLLCIVYVTATTCAPVRVYRVYDRIIPR